MRACQVFKKPHAKRNPLTTPISLASHTQVRSRSSMLFLLPSACLAVLRR
jgi:hypothetical protein